jgi:hypothetical protein
MILLAIDRAKLSVFAAAVALALYVDNRNRAAAMPPGSSPHDIAGMADH